MDYSHGFDRAPINWTASIVLIGTALAALTLVPAYLWLNDPSPWLWVWAFAVLWANGLSITAGYHRLWAHRAYEARGPLKLFYSLFGAMTLQNSILYWASTHRNHHKDVDLPEQDPYSIKRGFWFAHMGWMLRNYPSARPDYSNAPDLLADRYVAFQHKHYILLATGMNLLVPAAIGALHGDVVGGLLLVGLLRLVVSHQLTFCINSLAHLWGRQPYTSDNSARDNDLISFLTYGEGYHNFHHHFQWDYRNGIRWWQFDPTKWLIALCERFGLARNLKRVPEFSIQRARVQRQIERAKELLGRCRSGEQLERLERALKDEVAAYTAILSAWADLQQKKLDAARQKLAEQWQHSEWPARIAELENSLRLQHQRLQALTAQAAYA